MIAVRTVCLGVALAAGAAACGAAESAQVVSPAAAPLADAATPPVPPPVGDFRSAPPASGHEIVYAAPKVEEARLPNGVRLLVVERHDLPIVAVSVVIDAGAEKGAPGVANFVAAMLTQGTRSRSAIQISDALERLGASLNASADYDCLSISAVALTPALGEAIDLVADVTLHPAFDKAEVDRMRSRRLTALAQQNDSPQQLLRKSVLSVLYPSSHPYASILLGDEASIAKVSPADLAAFYAAYAAPDRTTVAFAGDITKAAALAEAERAFGKWSGHAVKAEPPAPPKPISASDPRVILVDRPGATQSFVAVALPGVSRNSPDFDAILVLDMVLGGQFSSRLNMNLREKHAYTYGARSSFDMRHGAGPFTAGGAIVRESTGPAVKEILSELARIRTEDVSDSELADAKSLLIRSLPSKFESSADTANSIAALSTYGLPLDEYETRPMRLRGVTGEDVKRVANAYLAPEQLRLVVVGDASVVHDPLASVGLGEVTVTSARKK